MMIVSSVLDINLRAYARNNVNAIRGIPFREPGFEKSTGDRKVPRSGLTAFSPLEIKFQRKLTSSRQLRRLGDLPERTGQYPTGGRELSMVEEVEEVGTKLEIQALV
jgi:hypothetical protein